MVNKDEYKTFSEKRKIQNTNSIIYYILLKYPIVKWFCGLHIHISFHLAKLLVMYKFFVPYCISKKFYGFHVGVCSWITDYQLLTVVGYLLCLLHCVISTTDGCILINILYYLILAGKRWRLHCSARQSWMEASGLWPMFHWEQQASQE